MEGNMENDNIEPKSAVEVPPIPETLNQKKKLSLTLIVPLIFFILVAGSAVAYYLSSKSIDNNDNLAEPLKGTNTSSISTVVDANDYFAFNLYHEIQKSESGNLFISPLSISMALTMTANGASDSTLTEMKTVLGLSNISTADINAQNKKVIDSINTNSKVKFSIANSIWVNKNEKVSFLPDFVTSVRNYYDGEAKEATNKEEINSWVSDKTDDKINNILSDFNSVLYLVNAVYFKANWENAFGKGATADENFTLESGSKKTVKMMSQQDSFNYYGDGKVQLVSLPYSGGDYQMNIFLPAKGTKVTDYVSGMDWEKYQALVAEATDREVLLKLPRFKVEYKNSELVKTMQDLGMTEATGEKASFSNMSSDPLKIGLIIHQSFIAVDEDGTEAAAATVVGMMDMTSAPAPKKPIEMTIDRPFFYTIEDSSTHNIIFMGVTKDPAE
jgi:serpin B